MRLSAQVGDVSRETPTNALVNLSVIHRPPVPFLTERVTCCGGSEPSREADCDAVKSSGFVGEGRAAIGVSVGRSAALNIYEPSGCTHRRIGFRALTLDSGYRQLQRLSNF